MIRGDDIDIAAEQFVPERFLRNNRSQRRSALRDRAKSLHVFFGEEQEFKAIRDKRLAEFEHERE